MRRFSPPALRGYFSLSAARGKLLLSISRVDLGLSFSGHGNSGAEGAVSGRGGIVEPEWSTNSGICGRINNNGIEGKQQPARLWMVIVHFYVDSGWFQVPDWCSVGKYMSCTCTCNCLPYILWAIKLAKNANAIAILIPTRDAWWTHPMVHTRLAIVVKV